MKMKALLLSVAVFCLGGAAMADSPFEGTWKLDPAKSHLAGDTMALEDAGGGSIKYTDSDQSYTSKPDGSPFTTPTGSDRTFSKNADGSYTVTVKLHGTLLRTNTWTPSSDGKTMTVESKATTQAKWDGKDYAVTGPTVPDGITLALTKTGPASFTLVQKSKGKVLATLHYHVAADGKSMITRGVNGAGKEPFTEVWEKAS